MIKRLVFIFFSLALPVETALCDWHHHGHGSTGAPDPNIDAFIWTCALVLVASVAILILGWPILVPRVRRIRDLFWVVPVVNIYFYLISISLRTYPGGFTARFKPPGLEYTIFEIVLLLIASLVVSVILAAVKWSKRTVGRFINKQVAGTEQIPSPLPSPGTGYSETEEIGKK